MSKWAHSNTWGRPAQCFADQINAERFKLQQLQTLLQRHMEVLSRKYSWIAGKGSYLWIIVMHFCWQEVLTLDLWCVPHSSHEMSAFVLVLICSFKVQICRNLNCRASGTSSALQRAQLCPFFALQQVRVKIMMMFIIIAISPMWRYMSSRFYFIYLLK